MSRNRMAAGELVCPTELFEAERQTGAAFLRTGRFDRRGMGPGGRVGNGEAPLLGRAPAARSRGGGFRLARAAGGAFQPGSSLQAGVGLIGCDASCLPLL